MDANTAELNARIPSREIGFFYPSYMPVAGGASVHGYYLARELTHLGYSLHTFNRKRDDFSHHYRLRPWNVFRVLHKCDLVYARLHLQGRSRSIPVLAKRMGKRLIVELNGPSDELIASKNYSLPQIEKLDTELSVILKKADHVITVSELMKAYISGQLGIDPARVHAIHNGGEPSNPVIHLPVTEKLKSRLAAMRNKYPCLVLWSGSHYPWQGFGMLREILSDPPEGCGFIVVSNDPAITRELPQGAPLLHLQSPERQDLQWLLTQVDAGLAIYGDFSWSRIGAFHGSSLKYWEYLINGLQVVSTPSGHIAHDKYPNLHLVTNSEQARQLLHGARRIKPQPELYRSWKQVAIETATVIESMF